MEEINENPPISDYYDGDKIVLQISPTMRDAAIAYIKAYNFFLTSDDPYHTENAAALAIYGSKRLLKDRGNNSAHYNNEAYNLPSQPYQSEGLAGMDYSDTYCALLRAIEEANPYYKANIARLECTPMKREGIFGLKKYPRVEHLATLALTPKINEFLSEVAASISSEDQKFEPVAIHEPRQITR